jgi:D-amino-acid oxidase
MYRVETADGKIGYIIPQSDSVVLGGRLQSDGWNAIPKEVDTRHIRSVCAKILLAIGLIQDGQEQISFRPYRNDGIRLELERTADGIDVVHCYGHSGAGITLSWGCAKDVAHIVKTLLPIDVQQPNKLPEHKQLWRLV